MFVALFGYWLLPNYPIDTKWLSEEQRHYAAWRLAVDMGSDDSDEDLGLLASVKMAVKDPKLYLFMLIQHLILLSQSFQYVFPSVVKTLGYSTTITSLLTAPPWFAAFLAGLATTWSASRTQQRGYYIVGTMFLSAVGNMMVTFGTSLGVRYTGMIFLCMGVLSAFQIALTWVSNSFARPTGKRAACIAMVNLFGNSANTYGAQLYPSRDGPQYRLVSRPAIVRLEVTLSDTPASVSSSGLPRHVRRQSYRRMSCPRHPIHPLQAEPPDGPRAGHCRRRRQGRRARQHDRPVRARFPLPALDRRPLQM